MRGLRPAPDGPPSAACLLPPVSHLSLAARRDQETAATLARLHAENAALRQRVGELERLVGQLKRRLWPRRSAAACARSAPIGGSTQVV